MKENMRLDRCGRVYLSRSAGETQGLGQALSSLLLPGDVVLLDGDLGAGKTCFAQGVARGLGVREQVVSPTFTLLREYRGRMPLYHLDAYRLQGDADLFSMGVEEYAEGDGVLLVEWGERAPGFFVMERLEVRFEFGAGDDDRRLVFTPRGDAWSRRICEMPREGGEDGKG